MWLALMYVVVSQAPVNQPDPQKLQLALTLDRAGGPAAETKLRAEPLLAAPALSAVMRAQGPSAVQSMVRTALKCPLGAPGSSFFIKRSPASDSAALLLAFSAEREDVRKLLAQSGNVLDLLLAVMASWADEPALAGILASMEVSTSMTEPERELLGTLSQCSLIRAAREKVPSRSQILSRLSSSSGAKRVQCDDAESAAGLLADGAAPTVKSWGTSGDEEVVTTLEVGNFVVSAKPACLLALYDAAPSPKLLDPILRTKPGPSEAAALERLARDLEKFEPGIRKEAVRQLIGHGRSLELLSEFTTQEVSGSEELLKGALLADRPDAQKMLFTQLSCPWGGATSVNLLLVLKDKKAARAEALRELDVCPRAGSAAATVLAELGDMSWVKRVAFLYEDPFGRFELERLLKAKWSPALETQLRAAKGSEEFTRWRDDLLAQQAKKR